jgi:hypothetical protein
MNNRHPHDHHERSHPKPDAINGPPAGPDQKYRYPNPEPCAHATPEPCDVPVVYSVATPDNIGEEEDH